MGLFFWKKNKQIDVFASALADEFYSAVAPDLAKAYLAGTMTGKSSDRSTTMVNRKLKDVIDQLQKFRAATSLGIYGKARFHLTFVSRLVELGYEKEVAERLNEQILINTP